MKQVLAISLAVTLAVWFVLAAVPVAAHRAPPERRPVDIDVVSDSNTSLRSFPFRSGHTGPTMVTKRYLEATQGENYGIVVRNRSRERIGVVIAVDGRNIISGERSELGDREPMYIVAPGATGRYDGWRTSADEVHRFFFTAQADSYAVRTFGDTSSMGSIAVAVYREKPAPPELSLKRESAAPSAARSGAAADAAKKSAGTGFGDSSYSPVVNVAFEPERLPFQKELIKYEWREALCRKRLLECGEEPATRLWDDARYAPYPPPAR